MISGKNNVYCFFGGQSPVNAGANYTAAFNLNDQNHTLNIKSILFDIKLFNAATFELLPINRNSFIHTRLNIGTVAGAGIGRLFENFTAGFAPVIGSGFSFYKPTFVLFDSFFVRNVLPCNFYIENHDAAINVGFEISVVMEVEEIE
jgi:hypothetical protein